MGSADRGREYLDDAWRKREARRCPVVWFAEAKMPTASPAIIKTILDAGGFGVIYGESASGKTFLAIDMMYHIAHGVPWRGLKVQKSLVVYVAAEDRGIEEYQLRPLVRQLKDSGKIGRLWPEVLKLFREADKHYDSQLFARQRLDELDTEHEPIRVTLEGLYGTPNRSVEYAFDAIDAGRGGHRTLDGGAIRPGSRRVGGPVLLAGRLEERADLTGGWRLPALDVTGIAGGEIGHAQWIQALAAGAGSGPSPGPSLQGRGV